MKAKKTSAMKQATPKQAKNTPAIGKPMQPMKAMKAMKALKTVETAPPIRTVETKKAMLPSRLGWLMLDGLLEATESD